jgi:hypothetical protein
MPFTGAANARAADDLAWLEKNLDGFVGNIRATAVTRFRGGLRFRGWRLFARRQQIGETTPDDAGWPLPLDIDQTPFITWERRIGR